VIGRLAGGAQGQVGVTPAEADELIARSHIELQQRVLRQQRLERRQHQPAQHGVGRGEPHPARHALVRPLGAGARGFQLGLYALGMLHQASIGSVGR
jgi:hypothetical protein